MDDKRQRFIDAHLEWYQIMEMKLPLTAEHLGIEWDDMPLRWRDNALRSIETNLTIAKVAKG